MTVEELIEQLNMVQPSLEVAILDGFNGGGSPRALNFGPTVRNVLPHHNGGNDYFDIETRPGKPVCLLGFGCY